MTVRRITRSDDTALPAIARIYEASIPFSERKPTSWLAEAAARPDFALLAAEVDGVALGFATVFVPGDSAALLEYLAVDAEHRSSGIGSALFTAVVANAKGSPLLIEVEPGIDEITRRRVDFYVRNGCRTLDGLRYLLPLNTTPPTMALMLTAADGPTTRPQLKHWLDTIYQRVYGQPADDPRVDRMVEDFFVT